MYFYYTNNATDAQSEAKNNNFKDPQIKPELLQNFGKHPLFAISREKVDAMSAAKSTDLAMAMPFISLECLNSEDNNVSINYTLNFFQNQPDFNKIAMSDKRFSERPVMSLKDLSIKQQNPGGGTNLVQEVTMNLRVHSLDEFSSKGLSVLLFPGTVLRLTYGWNGIDKGPEFLNEKRRMLICIKNYRLNLTQDLQMDLAVEATSFSNELSNLYLGDTGEDKEIKLGSRSLGMARNYKHLKLINSHLNNIASNRNGKEEEKIIRSLRESLTSVSKAYSEQFLENLKTSFNRIEPQDNAKTKKKNDAEKVPDLLYSRETELERKSGSKNVKLTKRYIALGDLIDVFLGETFRNLSGKVYPSQYKTRFLFGCANSEADKFSNLPLYKFPVDWTLFRSEFENQLKNSEVFTLGAFMTILSGMINNEDYYKPFVTEDVMKKGFRTPEVYLGMHNYTTGQKDAENVVELFLVDLHANVPKINTKQDEPLKKQNPNLPVIKLGHMGSFIKSLTMENVTDSAIQAHLINQQAMRSITSPVDDLLKKEVDGSESTTGPIYLPLQGEIEVLGSPEWGFGKSFIINVGLKAIDGLYQILETEHQINATGFSTKMRIRCIGQDY